MAPTRSIKCINLPPSRLPRVLVSFGRISSVISDCDSATVRTGSECPEKFINLRLSNPIQKRDTQNAGATTHIIDRDGANYQFRQSRQLKQPQPAGVYIDSTGTK